MELDKLNVLTHNGDPKYDRFLANQAGEAALYWRSYNPDSNAGGQLVERFVWVSDIKNALDKTKQNPENFWDYLKSCVGTHLCDCGQPDFAAEAEEFMEKPNFIGCTDETIAAFKKLVEMERLMQDLNEALDVYYSDRDEIMSNYEWNAMFDRLTALETETGIIFKNSPTQKVSD